MFILAHLSTLLRTLSKILDHLTSNHKSPEKMAKNALTLPHHAVHLQLVEQSEQCSPLEHLLEDYTARPSFCISAED